LQGSGISYKLLCHWVLADGDRDGFITLQDFVPLYKTIAAVRKAFKRQDHHNNGQIDRYIGLPAQTHTSTPSSDGLRLPRDVGTCIVACCWDDLVHCMHRALHHPLSNCWWLLVCRYDFYQLLVDLELSDAQDTQQQLQDLADTAFRYGQHEKGPPWAVLGGAG
jgi:hypothetical protein